MAEKHGALTPRREEQRLERTRPWGWDVSPFRAMRRMADEMDRLFDDFGSGRRWSRPWRETGAEFWAPEVEVFQKNNELTIRADLPGLKREDVTVEITDNEVTIQGERKHEKEEEREGYYRSERAYGSFVRSFTLPESASGEKVSAEFKDGLLTVHLPKDEKAKPKSIDVKVS